MPHALRPSTGPARRVHKPVAILDGRVDLSAAKDEPLLGRSPGWNRLLTRGSNSEPRPPSPSRIEMIVVKTTVPGSV